MADSFSANVVAAFPFDQDALGPHGCYDYSPNKLGLTWSSPGAGLSDVQSKFGGISCYFDGSGYVSYPVNPAIGTGVFTFEAWVYPTTIAAGYAAIVSFVTGTLYRYGATFIWHQGGSRIATATITADAWYHVAIVRSAGVISLYLNGVAVATTYATAYDFSSLTHYLGANNGSTELFLGYMEDVRLTRAARYTTNFTPPDAFKGDYTAAPTFKSVLLSNLYGKPAFQWCLLDKTGRLIQSNFTKRQANTNFWWGGSGTLTGLVEIGTTPVKRRVRLYESNNGILLLEKWANDDGTYTFDTLSKTIYFTVSSVDHTGTYNDVIAARVRAV